MPLASPAADGASPAPGPAPLSVPGVPRWAALLAVVAPALALVTAVWRFGVDTVFADEIVYVDFVRQVLGGEDWTAWIWRQHNEHRVVPMKLVLALLAGPTAWNQRAEMFVSVGLSVLLAGVLWRLYRRSGGRTDPAGLLAFAPVTWLVFGLAQFENQFYGMMICHYFTALGAAAALWLLARGAPLDTVLAVLVALVAASSIVNGFVVFPAALVVLWARRAGRARWLLWCAAGVAAIALYLHDYQRPAHTVAADVSLRGAYRLAKFGFTTLGAPLAAGSVAWGLMLGAGLALAGAHLVRRWLVADPERRLETAPALALLLFGIGSAALVAAGRAFMFPIDGALESRYTTYTGLAWIGAYLMALAEARRGASRGLLLAFVSLFVPGLLAAEAQGFAYVRVWHRARLMDQYLVQTAAQQPEAALRRLGVPVARARSAADYLAAARLSAGAVPQRLVLPLAPAVAESDALRPGAAVEQRLVCPLATLHDVAVLARVANPARGRLEVTVTGAGRELARRTFAVADLGELIWLRLPLDPPLAACAGQELTVRVAADGAAPGDGVNLPEYEPYYAGRLLQAGVEVHERRLGLALDGGALGLLE